MDKLQPIRERVGEFDVFYPLDEAVALAAFNLTKDGPHVVDNNERWQRFDAEAPANSQSAPISMDSETRVILHHWLVVKKMEGEITIYELKWTTTREDVPEHSQV